MRFRVVFLLGALCSVLIALAMTLGRGLPDSKFAFSAYCNNEDSEVFVSDWLHPLTINISKRRGQDYQPTWSPDGYQIAFTSDRDDGYDIHLSAAVAGSTRNLTHQHNTGDGAPSWSPDGRYIAFILQMPNSLTLPYIAVMDVLTGGIREFPTINVGNYTYPPVWSPDSKYLAVLASQDELFSTEVFVLDMTTSEILDLSKSVPTVDGHPSWSPDSKRLAFASFDDTTGYIAVADVMTGELISLLGERPGYYVGATWLPNEQIIAALTDSGQVQMLDTAGAIVRVFELPQMLEPGQSFNGAGYIQASPDGNYIALLMSVASFRGTGIYTTWRNYLLDIKAEKIYPISPDSCVANPVVWPAQ
jgi:Tol biopolymer transport system component